MEELVDQLISFWDAQEPAETRAAVDFWHERMAWLGVHFPNDQASQLVDMRLRRALDRWSEEPGPSQPPSRQERLSTLIEAGTRQALREAATSSGPARDLGTNELWAEQVLGQVSGDLGVPRPEAARMVLEVYGGEPPAGSDPASPIGIIRRIAEQGPA